MANMEQARQADGGFEDEHAEKEEEEGEVGEENDLEEARYDWDDRTNELRRSPLLCRQHRHTVLITSPRAGRIR